MAAGHLRLAGGHGGHRGYRRGGRPRDGLRVRLRSGQEGLPPRCRAGEERAMTAPQPGGVLEQLFDLSGRVAVVTGATGVLGSAMARGLAGAGARVGVLGRRKERAGEIASEVENRGGEALALPADVLKREQLEAARDAVLERWGRVDVLVNAAGGNVPAATVSEGATFFGLPEEPLRE